ncbi:MAG: hypothetical protein EOQ42_25855 [Mesorhizobium sp.]|uniref:hypothetical protein n=1 Tax=unclassified Mesorhizobium TaxID=325217 RepID=UPI000FE858F0|nr:MULTISPECIES: hypothetical protein [unclassified Mesorhizobium]RWB29149.1 MAG: hypothetical protein EOQ43_20860 [Mesorhizobium sp.]RWB50862.1 MAG: hypothetical protein EOQ42_25855 [Mesorhizobium sp.]RWC32034.1 MAG: hypothetical protein EOS70_18145 [Mesorhizobium sp.]TGU01051.1 hypothetical protein EN807_15230 [Mesorhizobium sp. M5C.F.Ca.ET.164.01.1.1]
MSEPAPSIDTLIAHYELRVPVSVGRATISWNTLSQSVFALYQSLSGMDFAAAKATFFVVTSDRSQRDMTSELVKAKLHPSHPKLAKRAQSLLADINKIAGKRNDIAHVIFVDEHSPSKVAQYHERGHLKGKSGAELLDSIDKFTIDCLDIALHLFRVVDEARRHMDATQKIVRALLAYRPQLEAEELANQGGYGLLDVPAATPHSSEDERDQ